MAQLQTYKGYYLWRYVPSIEAAIIFMLLFLAPTLVLFWRIFKTRTWFCLAFAIGGLFEVVGYAARASAHGQTGKIMPLAIQNVYILLGPALFAASIYMTLGRIIRAVKGEKYSIIRASWLTRSFVLGNVFSFVVQGSAAGLMVTGSNAKLGENIVVAGLCIQVITFGVFTATAIIFQFRMRRSPTTECSNVELPWKQTLYMLYSVSALIMVRSIFRVVEYSMGQDGYSLNNEWTLYVFDSTPMFIVMVIFWYWYPGKIRRVSSDDEQVQFDQRKL